MRTIIISSILSALILGACKTASTAQNTSSNKDNNKGEDFYTFLYGKSISKNSFFKTKIIPGRPEQKPYNEYIVIISPAGYLVDLVLYDKNGKSIEFLTAQIMDDRSQLEMRFNDRELSFDDTQLYFTYKDREDIMHTIDLPSPSILDTVKIMP